MRINSEMFLLNCFDFIHNTITFPWNLKALINIKTWKSGLIDLCLERTVFLNISLNLCFIVISGNFNPATGEELSLFLSISVLSLLIAFTSIMFEDS